MIDNANSRALAQFDQTATIKFLSSHAAVLAEASLLSPHDTDAFRINLSSLQLDEPSSSVLLQLAEARDEFLTILLARYGSHSLCINLLRFSLRMQIDQITTGLSEFGESLLNKAQLLFNRAFFVYLGSDWQRRTLFSTILIDLAEVMEMCCERLESLSNEIALLIPNHLFTATSKDQSIDQHLVKELGFRDLATHQLLPLITEHYFKRELTAILSFCLDSMKETTEQLKHNKLKDDTAKLVVICDSLNAHMQMIKSLEFPRSSEMEAWELQRLSLVQQIMTIHDLFKRFAQEFLKVTSLSRIESLLHPKICQDMVRSIASQLISEGTPALKATEAATHLISYMNKQNLTAKSILPGELPKINPHLSIAALELLQRYEDDPLLTKSSSTRKHDNIERRNQLLGRFKSRISSTMITVLLLLGTGFAQIGCGVKLAPKSDLVDYRPPVDYHQTKRHKNSSQQPKDHDQSERKESKHHDR